MKYRYITCDSSIMTDPVCNHALQSKNFISSKKSAIRIEIPDDMKLDYVNAGTSTTDDTRTLAELNGTPVVKINGKWKSSSHISSILSRYPIHRWIQKMRDDGYYHTNNGFMNKQTYYQHLRQLSASA